MLRARDIIERLSKLDPDMPVVFRTNDCDYQFDLSQFIIEGLEYPEIQDDHQVVPVTRDYIVMCSDEPWE